MGDVELAPSGLPRSASAGKLQPPADGMFSIRNVTKQNKYALITFAFFVVAFMPWVGNQEFAEDFYEQSQFYRDYLLKTNLAARYMQAKATRSAVMEMRTMLEDYYGGPDFFNKSLLLGQVSEELHQEGLHFMAGKMARSLVWQDQFVIGTIGSSVTAAHDNCDYDSYQNQLQRLMEPIWKHSKVKFEVRNAGVGGRCGDTFKNQVWCLRNLVGDDVDIVHYSWSYFEVGKPPNFKTKGVEDHIHELFYRYALLMDHSPAPQILYVSERKEQMRDWPLDEQLLKHYGKYGVNIIDPSVWYEKLPGWKKPAWGQVGDGLHNTTRYGELEDVNTEEGLARRESLGVMYRNWHPGPLLFQTIADIMAYYYSSAMLLALDKVGKSKNPFKDFPKVPKVLNKHTMPKPLMCREEWCNVDEPPGCGDFEQPTFGKHQARVLDHNDPTNPLRLEPVTVEEPWVQIEGEEEVNLIPREERDLEIGCHHADKCGGWKKVANKEAGWLTLQLPKMEVGMIAVCFTCSAVDGCGGSMINNGLEVKLEDQTLPGPFVEAFEVCVMIQDRFQAEISNEFGHLHIGIRFPASSPEVLLSHVITL